MTREPASFLPPGLCYVLTHQYIPCVTSQQGPFFDKVGHWGVATFAGFQLFTFVHLVCNIIERLPTIYTVVYMYTNPCSVLAITMLVQVQC